MMDRRIRRWVVIIFILIAILISVSVISLCVGAAGISFRRIPHIIWQGRGTGEYSILFDIRLPRIILGFAIGGALSLAGTILQGIFRNPLVEPYTLGISGGASLGVCLNIAFKWYDVVGIIAYPISGFVGAALVVVFVYSLSMKRGTLKTQGILLTGVMISFISSSLVMLIMALSRSEDLHGIVFWIMGSLDEPNMLLIRMAVIGALAGLVLSYFFCLDLNALALGEEEAIHLGINVEKTKRILFILASILTGLSVSVAGIIGFVGLIIPHLMRMFTGTDHRILFVSTFLAGSSFLILCDTLARTVIEPFELPVGVITGIIGGAVFVYALSRKQVTL
ncbi:MAG: iron ABC transporter permease [Deltaproteobacteria bacterium]|uniref:Iron ABC transporter permease n=1 Tax=Candidatus Desulfacyla euxinica TaxID=2841693 RepID=A0A8J6T8D8_9DELT|nr:iron ABC transporter permease [Candidatus Desulfacyla euxinica]MBL7217474.1 iron ABC transporter permease [Desulfobacteraceae bacterium]